MSMSCSITNSLEVNPDQIFSVQKSDVETSTDKLYVWSSFLDLTLNFPLTDESLAVCSFMK